MWEPRRLTTLWASTACYRDGFTKPHHHLWAVWKMWEPRRLTTLWASTACYRDGFTEPRCHLWADCIDNVGPSTSHNPMGLQGLLQRQLYFLPSSQHEYFKYISSAWNCFNNSSSLLWDTLKLHRDKMLSVCLTKHHAMGGLWRLKEQLSAFLISAVDDSSCHDHFISKGNSPCCPWTRRGLSTINNIDTVEKRKISNPNGN
jgi:hypothetical protein